MEKIFRIFKKEYANINQAALLLGFFAFFSQILGLFRDRFIAHFIGPSADLDAYYAAFRVPDFIFISVASLASITVLIPFLSEKIEEEEGDGSQAHRFMHNVLSAFLIALVVCSLVVYIFMPEIVNLTASGFPPELKEKTTMLSRIMLLSPILLGLSNLFGSITQLFKKFFIYALSPVFYNLGIIFGILFLFPRFGIRGLAYGVVFGALMHFLIQLKSAWDSGFKPKIFFKINWIEIKKVVLVSLPRTLGLSFNNIALIAIIAFASYLTAGSISIFNLSFNMQSVPLGIIGLSYAVAAFPTLTQSYSAGKGDEFKRQLLEAGHQIVFWSIPVTFLFVVLRAQIVRVILGSGSFSWENTRLVAASLAIFSISVTAQGLIALFARAYYATGNTKKPLLVNLVSSASIVIFAVSFLWLFKNSSMWQNLIEGILRVSDIRGTEVLMLPLAYSLGTILNGLLLWFFARREFLSEESFISKTFFQSLSASFVLGVLSYITLNILDKFFDTNTFWGVFLHGATAGIVGIIGAVLALYIMGNQEFKDLVGTLKTKFWKAKVVTVSDQ